MTTTPRKRQPIDAIIAKRDEIDEMLAWFTELSDDHFNIHPDEATWGHVGTLEHYAELIKRFTDLAFKEGEHAE
jgi:hypothetical protein